MTHDRDPLPLSGVEPPSSPVGPAGDDQTTGFHIAARVSYLAPILAIAIGMITTAFFRVMSVRTATIIGILNLAILTTGAMIALFSLTGIPRHGRRGILWPAIAGLLLNLLLIGLMIGTLVQWQRATTRRADLAAPSLIHRS